MIKKIDKKYTHIHNTQTNKGKETTHIANKEI